jgi:hypothetical protein
VTGCWEGHGGGKGGGIFLTALSQCSLLLQMRLLTCPSDPTHRVACPASPAPCLILPCVVQDATDLTYPWHC